IMPATLSTVNATFRGRYRAAAFGVWGAVISGAAAIGPLAGGALTQYASWQWIFLVNVPLGLIVFITVLLWVRETRGGDNRPGADVDGALLSGIGFGAIVFAVIEGPDLGWWTPKADFNLFGFVWPKTAAVSLVPILLFVGIVALVLFVLWERHRGRNGRSALLDLKLFALPTFSWGNLTAGMVAVGEFAIIFVLPLYLINVLGLDVMTAGLILGAMAIGAFVSGASARHLAARLGAPGVVLLGLLMELLSVIVLVLVLTSSSSGWMLAAILIVYGLGLGLASAQLTSTVLRDVPTSESGQGSATQSTVRQVGTALGTAFSGAVLSLALATTLPNALSKAGLSGAAFDGVAEQTRQSAGTMIEILRQQGAQSSFGKDTPQVIQALAEGFSDGTRAAMLVAVVFLALGLVSAWRVRAVAKTQSAAHE
ncbi:MAG: MFS transporter, partial [Microbacteriaceae bacterium]